VPIYFFCTHSPVSQRQTRTVLWSEAEAPGIDDLLPMGFLKACGPPLAKILAAVATASFQISYFPKRFRQAGIIVVRKPGKTEAEMHTASGWRPIVLLSTIGKVIEAAMKMKIAGIAEEKGLLPESQMGNRPGRSTDLAIRLVTEAVYTAWTYKANTSLLQLDIKRVFDTVNHIRLLYTPSRAL
jgi:hypothetical protein